ncbi:hypothetical protein CVT24_006326 [Panaeolus cyanescens]|uniref:FAD-binding domain-containing protein n=1 Tax=Panaeolus cyanescens TaxID=181874 RepID=A0A409YEB3_9AGAR|nr:hypothetical protein CVT24_006326 [Panaeolus cyanescens]
MSPIPSHSQILIIGGGPGGSYAASCLGREGLDVVLLEAEVFPRYHIGESLLPSMRHFLRFIDLEKKFLGHGFYEKVGAAFKLGQHKQEGYTDFVAMDPNNYSWNVVRSESDELLLRHASTSGAKVFEGVRVTDINFQDGTRRPVSATWVDKGGKSGTISFDFLIDASGRRGLMSTKYLKNRNFTQSLKNIAMWGYWSGTGSYKPGTSRAGSPFFEALTDGSGWAWFIPLSKKTTSIGVVMNKEIYSLKQSTSASSSIEFYRSALLSLAPVITSLIGSGQLKTSDPTTTVRMASDYSYSASSYAGNGYRIVGDAGAFIDPFFSNGIHLATSGALSAAVTICASLRGDCSEEEACQWHTSRLGTSYTRFLVVVLSAYRQMKSQDQPILTDIDEDNFDRAFGHFRGIIQGVADVTTPAAKVLTEEELATTLEFCAQAYMPPNPDDVMFESKIQLVGIMASSETIDAVAANELHGKCMRLERGNLGLNWVKASSAP